MLTWLQFHNATQCLKTILVEFLCSIKEEYPQLYKKSLKMQLRICMKTDFLHKLPLNSLFKAEFMLNFFFLKQFAQYCTYKYHIK